MEPLRTDVGLAQGLSCLGTLLTFAGCGAFLYFIPDFGTVVKLSLLWTAGCVAFVVWLALKS